MTTTIQPTTNDPEPPPTTGRVVTPGTSVAADMSGTAGTRGTAGTSSPPGTTACAGVVGPTGATGTAAASAPDSTSGAPRTSVPAVPGAGRTSSGSVEPAHARVPAPRRADRCGVGGAGAPLPGAARADAHAPSAPAHVVRFAVLGDSLSEGVGDRVDGVWRGWAALLADGLAGPGQHVEFRNFAVSGAQSREVAEQQAPEAVAFRPDLVSVVVGVNDTLRHTFDIGRLARRLDRVCADLTADGAVLLTACLPDPGRMLGLPPPLARPLARRQKAVNALVHAISARYDTVHLHLADAAWTDDRSLWSADRLHPGERGHRAIAARFHVLLKARGLAHGAPPSPEPEQPPPTRTEALLWLATAGTGWVARRCHDLLPQLLHLAGAELRHWAGGSAARLDRRAEHALSAALAAVSLDATVATMGE
ncbi:SGNH/GDSL hydrolase family protein [Streptomyces sp. NPDC046712]|uniref:SGNH/GDSL hydrolase family protein n=1 Tax=Streptomyces sp. NPDC046712 TaxID=3154802 RepID=UPI0033E7FCF0